MFLQSAKWVAPRLHVDCEDCSGTIGSIRMAQPLPEQVIEAQRQDWNRLASGWEKWDRFFDQQMAFLNHRLVADARLRFDMRVLDLGSGTGYPALLGAQTVGASGSVIGVDLAEQMVTTANQKAMRLGLT
jgi:enediyne biosynthesis protein CalE5